MAVSEVSAQLSLHWVPVVDAAGRPHLEAVWATTPASVPTHHAA